VRTVRNITIAVDPDLYRQTRKIAADYDTTVTDMVRFLLLVLPEAVKAARYPGGRPQFGLAAARAAASDPSTATSSSSSPLSPRSTEISPCTPVNTSQPNSLEQLARQNLSPIQDQYFSIQTLKSIISKVLKVIS
jgi:hypothetical protein